MSRSARSPLFVCGIATLICTAPVLNASAGVPLLYKSIQNTQDALSNVHPVADSSQYDSTQYNPYSEDENNNLNQYPDTQIYYGDSGDAGYSAAGYGAAAAAGAAAAGLNEARNRNNRAAIEAEGRRNRANSIRTGQATHQNQNFGEGHHAEGFGGERHRESQRRSMGENRGRSMGGSGHGGRR